MTSKTGKKGKSGLTLKREKFIAEYLRCNNASEAYRIVFPGSRKWQESSVWEQSSRLLANPKVRSRMEELKERMVRKTLTTPQMIRDELAKMGFAYVPVTDKLKYSDKLKALELLGKELGMFRDQVKFIDPNADPLINDPDPDV